MLWKLWSRSNARALKGKNSPNTSTSWTKATPSLVSRGISRTKRLPGLFFNCELTHATYCSYQHKLELGNIHLDFTQIREFNPSDNSAGHLLCKHLLHDSSPCQTFCFVFTEPSKYVWAQHNEIHLWKLEC